MEFFPPLATWHSVCLESRQEKQEKRLTHPWPYYRRQMAETTSWRAASRSELHDYIVAAPASRTLVIDERPEERVMALSIAIDVYMAAMMQFFTRNVEHSVLGRWLADRRQASTARRKYVPICQNKIARKNKGFPRAKLAWHLRCAALVTPPTPLRLPHPRRRTPPEGRARVSRTRLGLPATVLAPDVGDDGSQTGCIGVTQSAQ